MVKIICKEYDLSPGYVPIIVMVYSCFSSHGFFYFSCFFFFCSSVERKLTIGARKSAPCYHHWGKGVSLPFLFLFFLSIFDSLTCRFFYSAGVNCTRCKISAFSPLKLSPLEGFLCTTRLSWVCADVVWGGHSTAVN